MTKSLTAALLLVLAATAVDAQVDTFVTYYKEQGFARAHVEAHTDTTTHHGQVGLTFVVAEGLLMYLERAQVVQLARDLAKVHWGGPAEFAYDYYCAQMVGQAWLNPSLRRLGAEFKWGMAGPEELSLGEPRWLAES